MRDELGENISKLADYKVKRESSKYLISPSELIALDDAIERLERKINELWEGTDARDEERAAPKLTLPKKADTWAKAMEATYEIMVQETGGAPSTAEVWLRMNSRPPANYPIKVTTDHGLAAIGMSGEKPLTREGFMHRWRRYMAAK